MLAIAAGFLIIALLSTAVRRGERNLERRAIVRLLQRMADEGGEISPTAARLVRRILDGEHRRIRS